MKRKLGIVTALVFALSLGLSTAFAQSAKPAMQTTGQQGATKTVSTAKKSRMKSRRLSKSHHRHHTKIARRVTKSEKGRKEKKAKEGKSERS